MYPGTEVKFQDIIYIENSKYNLPIIYDDKRNDSYDIIELIFDILKKNDNDYKSKIKKLLLDFNNEFIISDDNIDELKKLNINEQSFKDNRDDIVKEIKQIEDTKKCLDYMNNTIDFYKTEIAKILSYNLPKFYEEKSITPDVSFDINTILSDTNYVSDNIVIIFIGIPIPGGAAVGAGIALMVWTIPFNPLIKPCVVVAVDCNVFKRLSI
jgi:hypothetical protein